ncbi:hypothetical protein B0H13DRAFT_1857126 [Mycena leptocephala]|nr:hypothetical protein B0H13DRAFT_1857126 [Mycena leptocephala]
MAGPHLTVPRPSNFEFERPCLCDVIQLNYGLLPADSPFINLGKSVSETVVDVEAQLRKSTTTSDDGAPAPKKQRKERSDKGRKGGENEVDAGAGVNPEAGPKKKRKERSDKGSKRAKP